MSDTQEKTPSKATSANDAGAKSPDQVKAAICDEAAYQALVILQGHAEDGAVEFIDGDYVDKLYAFGLRQGWPPAEAFARQYAWLVGRPFSEEAWHGWADFRAAFEVFRAVGMALAALDLGLDGATVEAAAPAQRDPDDDALERTDGIFDRDRIGGAPAPVASEPATPLSAVDGIGEKIEQALMAVGIGNVEELAAVSDEVLEAWSKSMGLTPMGAHEKRAHGFITDRNLVVLAQEHLTKA